MDRRRLPCTGSLRRMSSRLVHEEAAISPPAHAVSSFARNAIGPTRSLTDAQGTFWQVCEVEFALDRRTGRSLVFESEGSVRRVRNYPATWHDLPDDELARLVEST